MKVEVLGCSGGKDKNSNLPSFLIDGKILFDCGSVCSSLSVERQGDIEVCFISHAHFDHICDLPFVADNLSISGKNLRIFATKETLKLISENVFNGKIWPDFRKIPDRENPTLIFEEVSDGEVLKIEGYEIEFFNVYHTEGSIGFIISDEKSKLAYTADTYQTNGLWKKLYEKGVKSIITECSFPSKRGKIAEVSYHLSVETFIQELKKMDKFDNIFVFHLKPHYKDLIEKELKSFDVKILKDGEIIEI
ncbi:3',5'-cyclic-nucleotide phosphodiesterase [Thermotomaculum hydrothermale]|uniref:3',5'-cyclic-nucleotide phosphodiesterase n=1 Tax=Thermotomaculum hydrothermale TaxID=981385 RepID=A0A7R6PUP4_9BACT|nr:3',5'-cyclic-nucleotide phosphodiesterase [Thermotomaculum hydrothermale]BBB33027.1 3',5'-cyclic-nucleotide phosphodiesterase [Thermotomaculum hydrothermale]